MKDLRGKTVECRDSVAVVRGNAGIHRLALGEVIMLDGHLALVKTDATPAHRSFSSWTAQVIVLENRT